MLRSKPAEDIWSAAPPVAPIRKPRRFIPKFGYLVFPLTHSVWQTVGLEQVIVKVVIYWGKKLAYSTAFHLQRFGDISTAVLAMKEFQINEHPLTGYIVIAC
jgi:hypothetical protein